MYCHLFPDKIANKLIKYGMKMGKVVAWDITRPSKGNGKMKRVNKTIKGLWMVDISFEILSTISFEIYHARVLTKGYFLIGTFFIV